MKEHCGPSSKRMFPSALTGPVKTVAMAVFGRRVKEDI